MGKIWVVKKQDGERVGVHSVNVVFLHFITDFSGRWCYLILLLTLKRATKWWNLSNINQHVAINYYDMDDEVIFRRRKKFTFHTLHFIEH